MKKYFLFFLINIFIFISYAEVIIVDFDESMGIKNRARYNIMLKAEGSKTKLNFFREIWQKNNPSKKRKVEGKYKIPKIIHQIWIGPSPLPKLYEKYQKSWKIYHPDWVFKLWTDKDLENLDLENRDLFEKAPSYQEKADILRYEILKKFGGLYLDVDHLCLQNFDELIEKYSFFAALEPPLLYSSPTLSNAMIGSYPGNPLFKDLLTKIRQDWDKEELKKFNDHAIAAMRSMLPLTEVYIESGHLHDKSVIFPATYFFPIFPQTSWLFYNFKDNIKIFLEQYKDVRLFNSLRPETLAYHDFLETFQ